MSDIVANGLAWLIDFYALATILLFATVIAHVVSKQPCRRIAVSWAALIGVVVVAITSMTSFWPRTNLGLVTISSQPITQAKRQASTIAIPVAKSVTTPTITSAHRNDLSGGEPEVLNSSHDSLTKETQRRGEAVVDRQMARYLLFGFFAVGGTLSLCVCVGCLQASRLIRGSQAAPANLREALGQITGNPSISPDLRISNRLGEPVATGLFRQTILLPVEFAAETDQQSLEAALTHELTHIRRGDLWLLAVFRWLMPLLFAHPLFWWLRRRIRVDQEYLADSATANRLSHIVYAEVLVKWSRTLRIPRRLSGMVATMIGDSLLKQRIELLLDNQYDIDQSASRFWKGGAVSGVAVAVVTLCSFTLSSIARYDAGISVSASAPADGSHVDVLSNDASIDDDSPLIAHLTCDITLELVEIRDGSEAVIRVRNPNSVPLQWSHGESSIRFLNEAEFGSDVLIAVPLSVSDQTADLRFAVALGSWETRGDSKTELAKERDGYTFSVCDDADNELVVSVTHPIEKGEVQLVAVDSSGCQHQPIELTPSSGSLTAAFSQLPLDRIDEFRIQSREKRWVEFRNISLKPGDQSEAEIKVCGINGRHERGHVEL